jgi:hypothetical protein
MGNPDDGTDEGPRSPTGRVSMGQGTTGLAAGVGGSPNGGGDDYGGEGPARNLGIGKYLQGYTNSADDTGWGDASGENAPPTAEVNATVIIASADDGWGNLNDPRAVTGLTQLLLAGSLNGGGGLRTAASGIVHALAVNGAIHTQLSGLAV